MSRLDPARARRQADEGSTLVLLHPGEIADGELRTAELGADGVLHAREPDAALAGHLVALLFAASGPISVTDAARLLSIPVERVGDLCQLLDREPPTGLALQRFDDRLSLTTAPGSSAIVERYLGAPPPVRLSRAALEALAVIAYRQPVTRGEIDAVRGVNSDSAVATLLGRNLVGEVGRRETVGHPALLALTPECLQYLGIRSLAELPPLPPASD